MMYLLQPNVLAGFATSCEADSPSVACSYKPIASTI